MENILTLHEAAEKLDVANSTILKWIGEKRINRSEVKLGRNKTITLSSFDDFKESEYYQLWDKGNQYRKGNGEKGKNSIGDLKNVIDVQNKEIQMMSRQLSILSDNQREINKNIFDLVQLIEGVGKQQIVHIDVPKVGHIEIPKGGLNSSDWKIRPEKDFELRDTAKTINITTKIPEEKGVKKDIFLAGKSRAEIQLQTKKLIREYKIAYSKVEPARKGATVGKFLKGGKISDAKLKEFYENSQKFVKAIKEKI